MNRYDKQFNELISELNAHENQLDIMLDVEPNMKNPCIFKCHTVMNRVEVYLTNLNDDILSKLSVLLSSKSNKKILYVVKDYQQLEQYETYYKENRDKFNAIIQFKVEYEFENEALNYKDFNYIIFDDFTQYMDIQSVRNKLIIKLLDKNPQLKLIGFVDKISGKLINEYAYLGIKFDHKMNKIVKQVFAKLSEYEQFRDDTKIDEAIRSSQFNEYLSRLEQKNINYIISYPKI